MSKEFAGRNDAIRAASAPADAAVDVAEGARVGAGGEEALAAFGRDAPRAGEICGVLPKHFDAGLYFIGTIRTPFARREDCPRQGDLTGPECRLLLRREFAPALLGLARHRHLELLYFMDEARRDLLVQRRRGAAHSSGTFALRSPARPNPLASSIVKLERIEGEVLVVRGLDCRDGTPLIDLKPAALTAPMR